MTDEQKQKRKNATKQIIWLSIGVAVAGIAVTTAAKKAKPGGSK